MENLNDISAEIDEQLFEEIIADMNAKGQLDKNLAAHIAHLFIRDPLVIFSDAIQIDDSQRLVSVVLCNDLNYCLTILRTILKTFKALIGEQSDGRLQL